MRLSSEAACHLVHNVWTPHGDQLAIVWRGIGRLGVEKLAAATQQRGCKVSQPRAAACVRGESTAPLFQSRPLSKDNGTAASMDSRWTAEMMHCPARHFEASLGLHIRSCSRGCWAPHGHGRSN